MKIILSQDIPKVGKKNEVKEVADGYARNWLLPKGLARPATEAELAQLELIKAQLAQQAEADLKIQEEVVSQIDGQEFEMVSKADDTGKLYGSITPIKVAKLLKDKGFSVAKNNVKMAEPIKTLGEHEIILEMDHGLEAKIKLIINEQAAEAKKEKEEDLV